MYTHWVCLCFCRRSGDDPWTDRIKRKKPCMGEHEIKTCAVVTTTAAAVALSVSDEQLCVSMSPMEEPVQLSHKRLPRPPRPADDLRASRLIDHYVDQICMNDGTFIGAGDRLSIVSPLAKQLADIRLRRSPVAHKRKRIRGDRDADSESDDGGGGGRKRRAWWPHTFGGGLTLPDGLPSPFHAATVPPSPITPLMRRDPDESDDYWKTPVERPSSVCIGRDSLSTTSSKTVEDEIMCCGDPRSPAVLDETFTLKSRRCLSFVSPPPSSADSPVKKKNRRSSRKTTVVVTPAAASDKGKCMFVTIYLFINVFI